VSSPSPSDHRWQCLDPGWIPFDRAEFKCLNCGLVQFGHQTMYRQACEAETLPLPPGEWKVLTKEGLIPLAQHTENKDDDNNQCSQREV